MVEQQDRLAAGFELLGRTGAAKSQIEHRTLERNWSQPPVWIAAAWYDRPGGRVRVVAAANEPDVAVLRLLEQVVDGGHCTHCHKPTGVTGDTDEMPAGSIVCWYQYDPELKTYRRGCEGD